MIDQINLLEFDKIYDDTYHYVLRYIICKCSNLDDVNDILQETYLEFWNILNRKKVTNQNIKVFIIRIADHKIRKHYSLRHKLQTISLFSKKENDMELIDIIPDYEIDIEKLKIDEETWRNVWEYLKMLKNKNIPKIFYLYYYFDLTIKEISIHLTVSESYVKNSIYRTIKELRSIFEKEQN